MSQSDQSLQDDIAYMKTLVADGGQVPALAGAHLVAAGIIYGAPLIVTWAGLEGILNLPRGVLGAISLWSTAVYLPVMVLLVWMGRRLPRGGGTGRTFVAAWGNIGLVTVTILACLIAVSFRLHRPELLAQVWPPIAVALYAGAWCVFAIGSRRSAWWLVTLGCCATALAVALLTGDPAEYLVLGLGLLLWMAAPGALLMWRARPPA